MARKLKKSALSGLKEKQAANVQVNVQKINQATEIVTNAKKLMDIGMVYDAIVAIEQLLASRLPLNNGQQEQIKEMMTYFVERSLKRMKDYPHILQFMGINPAKVA